MITSINKILAALIFLFFWFKPIRSDVSISMPSTGQTYAVSGSSVSVELSWIDSGATPAISTAESYTFLLCTGEASNIIAVSTLAKDQTLTATTYTASIPATVGASGVYYIQIYTTYPGGYTIHYSNRFELTGMTGTTATTGSLSDAPPPAVISISTGSTAVTATMDVSASFKVTYTSQTGIYRFAPMQTQPGTTVTATTWTRQFPTSSVDYFLSLSGSPSVQSTITPGWSYSRTSHVNAAPGLGTPTGAYKPTGRIRTPYIKETDKATKSKRFLHLDDDDDDYY